MDLRPEEEQTTFIKPSIGLHHFLALVLHFAGASATADEYFYFQVPCTYVIGYVLRELKPTSYLGIKMWVSEVGTNEYTNF